MNIQTLALANECTTIGSQVDNFLLTYFPNSLIDSLRVIGNGRDILDRTIVSDDHILHVVIPETAVDEFAQKPWADDLELASKNTTCVNIAIDAR